MSCARACRVFPWHLLRIRRGPGETQGQDDGSRSEVHIPVLFTESGMLPSCREQTSTVCWMCSYQRGHGRRQEVKLKVKSNKTLASVARCSLHLLRAPSSSSNQEPPPTSLHFTSPHLTPLFAHTALIAPCLATIPSFYNNTSDHSPHIASEVFDGVWF